MDPSGIYLNDLESFTDDLSKYDAKLYLGLDELSIARRTAVNTQKEAATLHPHPPPPLYAPGARLPVDYQQDHSHQFSRASEHKESNVAFRPKRPTSGAAQFYPQYPLPYAQHSQPIFSQRSASATLPGAADAIHHGSSASIIGHHIHECGYSQEQISRRSCPEAR